MRLDTARRFALSLPETTEEPHFDMASWRVAGKIFATVPNDPKGQLVHVFVDEAEARACAESSPSYELLWWGKKLSGLRVRLAAADRAEVCELLEAAWRRRAPKRLQGAR
jgi:hypothetical protein